MKSNHHETNQNEKDPIFLTGTSLSDPNAWFISLVRQIREYRAERRSPTPRAKITATPDPDALDRLVNHPNQIASLFSLVKVVVNEKFHPHHIETTATPVDVKELWQKRQNRIPELLSVLVHVGVVAMMLVISVSTTTNRKLSLTAPFSWSRLRCPFRYLPRRSNPAVEVEEARELSRRRQREFFQGHRTGNSFLRLPLL